MNATKRKFNALVQGMGNRSTPGKSSPGSSSSQQQQQQDAPSTDNLPASAASGSKMALEAELLSKRRRLGMLDSNLPAAKPSSATTTTISNVVLRKWSGQQQPGKDAPPAASRYCPSDRAELVRRLGTFQELTDWTPKPERVNEVEWAKRGWVCQGKERVRCTLCNKEVVVKLNRKVVDGKEVSVLVASEIETALVDKYVPLMVESHQEDCLWRKRGCDDSLLRLSFANTNTSFEQLRARYDELCARKSFLPYEFNLRLPAELDMSTVLSQLPTDFFTSPPPPKEASDPTAPNRVALALALLGWQGLTNARIGAVPNSASCHTCLRRLGLWMFKSKEVGADGTVITPAPMDHLDPVKEHRFFCPWRNAQAQRLGSARPNPSTDLAAWQMMAQSLKNEAYLRGLLDESPKKKQHRKKPSETTTLSSPFRRSGLESSGGAGEGDGTTDGNGVALGVFGPDGQEEEEAARDAKDKERWARLRKVKSLFDTKSGKKLRRTASRPGTATSTASTLAPGK